MTRETVSLFAAQSIVGMDVGKYAVIHEGGKDIIVTSCPNCGFQQTVECDIHVDGTLSSEMECHNEKCKFKGPIRLHRWTTTKY